MKNLFLCFALVGMASTLCAQERGDMLVSGSLSWNSSSTKTTVSSTSETTKGSRSFEFTPQFHYFVINKLWESATRSKKTRTDEPVVTTNNSSTRRDCSISNRWPATTFHWARSSTMYPVSTSALALAKTNRNSPVKRSPKKMRRSSGSESQLSTSNSDRPTTSASCSTQAIWAIRLPSSNKTAITKYPTGTSRSA